jgi:hypothetical protein
VPTVDDPNLDVFGDDAGVLMDILARAGVSSSAGPGPFGNSEPIYTAVGLECSDPAPRCTFKACSQAADDLCDRFYRPIYGVATQCCDDGDQIGCCLK